jgi:hypothetical protein
MTHSTAREMGSAMRQVDATVVQGTMEIRVEIVQRVIMDTQIVLVCISLIPPPTCFSY